MHTATTQALQALKAIGVNLWETVDNAVKAAEEAMAAVDTTGVPVGEMTLLTRQKDRVRKNAAAAVKVLEDNLGD